MFSIDQILVSKAKSYDIIHNSARLLKLQVQFYACLDNLFAQDHCKLDSVNDNKLFIVADSPVWAAYIRYNQADIIAKLISYSNLSHICVIEVKVCLAPN